MQAEHLHCTVCDSDGSDADFEETWFQMIFENSTCLGQHKLMPFLSVCLPPAQLSLMSQTCTHVSLTKPCNWPWKDMGGFC